MFILDTHTYVIAQDSSYPMIPNLTADWVRYAVTVEELIQKMDAAGVAKATLIQALQAHGYDNSYTIDSARASAGRFEAVGMYDLADEGTPSKLRYEVTHQGVRGARVTPRSLTSASALATWEVVDELELPVVIAAATPSAFPEIEYVAGRFTKAKILLEGLALTNEVYEGPPFSKQSPLFELSKHANIYLKWCTDQLIDIPTLEWQQAFLQLLVQNFGAERVMWGSRYPFRHEPDWTYQSQVDAAMKAVAPLSEQHQRLLMGEAALRLWPELA